MKSNAKSFGFVMFMENNSDGSHIPLSKSDALLGLLKELYDKGVGLKGELLDYVIGHEHGDENGNCHFQIYLKFSEKVRKQIKPGSFVKNEVKLLYMSQTSKTPEKLRNYCKKDKDYIEDFPGKTLKNILKEKGILNEAMDLDDPYNYILNKKDLDSEKIIDVFKSCTITDHKKTFLCNMKSIIENYNTFIKKDNEELEFAWHFPEHMIYYIRENTDENDIIGIVYNKLFNWYNENCLKEGFFRRKALFLFSLKGGLGKSCFARSLVSEDNTFDSPFYIYCRGTLDAQEFIKKKETARLVILDDVNYVMKDIEIWKALTVSEPTNLRTPYYNMQWDKSLPCILMSNNVKTLKYWMETEDLKTRCVFIGINFFIGPPGTDKENYHVVDSFVTNDISKKLSNNSILNFFNK